VKFVGRINSVCGKRLLILRCDAAQLPRLQTEVTDRRLKPIGKLVDLFGNIAAPYATVLCYTDCDRVAGEKLYAK
jgi:RNA-binding protein